MKKMPYACLYPGYLEQYSTLSDAQFGKLLRGLLQYMQDGQDPQLTGLARHFWLGLRQQYQRDEQAYYDRVETNRKNGAKGGRPRKTEKPMGSQEPEILTQKPNEKDNEKDNDNENEIFTAPKRPEGNPFVPPTVQEVKDYCQKEKIATDCEEFVNYYTARGWYMGTAAMQDWKAAIKAWAKNERRLNRGKSVLPNDGAGAGVFSKAMSEYGPLGICL